jgi:hypothetical protein
MMDVAMMDSVVVVLLLLFR